MSVACPSAEAVPAKRRPIAKQAPAMTCHRATSSSGEADAPFGPDPAR